MKFLGAKDNNILKAKMVADLGKTLGASTSLVEQIIKYHNGLSISLEIRNAHHSQVIGIDKESKFRKKTEMVKTRGLWPYLSEKATQGWTDEKVLARLKRLVIETDWSKMSKFAALYDRETVRRIRTRESSGQNKDKPIEGDRI